MAKRDVQLVIRARSEADRAIESISAAMRTLLGVQDDLSTSGAGVSTTLERMGGAFAAIDAAFAKIDGTLAQANSGFERQRASLAENEAQYAALRGQVVAAEQAIVNTRIAMQSDGSRELAGRLGAAVTGYKQLTGEASRLEGRIAVQRAEVLAAADAQRDLQHTANVAAAAAGEMGREGERAALATRAASLQANLALKEQAATQREASASAIAMAAAEADALRQKARAIAEQVAEQRRLEASQAGINSLLGVRAPDSGAGSARESAAVFEEDARAKKEAARATDDLSAAADRLRARARPLVVEEQRLNAEIREANTLFQAGKIGIRDYTAEMVRLEGALKRTQAAAASGNRNGSTEIKGLFGLRPYEMQNLSYQINDVVSGLASGQPIGQVFAQQAGQIVQIFPQVLDFVLKYARGLGLVAVALTPVIIGMSRMNSLAAMQRDFAATLGLSADGARYNTEALIANTDALDLFGASAEDAAAAVKTFLAEAVDPDMLDAFGRAAQNLADITGEDLTDAAKDVAAAFTGGYEAIADFDDKMNFLTLSEREQIRAMFDSGKESDARALAFQRFYDKAQDGTRETETAWSRMTDAMAGAWATFENYLAGTQVFANLRSQMNDVAVGATYLFNRLRGVAHEAAALDALGKKRVNGPNANANPFGTMFAGRDNLGNPIDPLNTASDRYRKEESDRLYDEAKKKRPKKSRKTGKTDADYQADFNRQIRQANEERERQAENLTRTNVLEGEALILEKRRQAVAEALHEAEKKATDNGKRKLVLTQAQRAEIARTVGLEFDAKNAKAVAQAEQQAHERALNVLVEKRKRLLDAMDYASAGSDEFKNLQSAVLGVNVQIEAATRDMAAFWQTAAGNPETLALLGVTTEQARNIVADLENDLKRVQRETLEAAQARAESGLSDLEAMQRLLQEQIEFAQLQGEAGRAGALQTQLAEVNQRLAEGAQKAVAFWRAIRGNPAELALMGLTPAAVDNIILGFENTIAASERLRTQFLKTGQALNQDLANGGVTAMERFAQSIVNGENVLSSFAASFLQFAADFLLNIARMIAQQAIFNALSAGSAGGAGGAGGFLSSLIGSLFHGGGIAMNGGRGRGVPAAIFANAARYHSGGIAGLRPNEVPAILERGEEVLTRADARHARNGGKGGGGRQLAQILAIGEDQIAKAMAGAAGREVMLSFIRSERMTINQELGAN